MGNPTQMELIFPCPKSKIKHPTTRAKTREINPNYEFKGVREYKYTKKELQLGMGSFWKVEKRPVSSYSVYWEYIQVFRQKSMAKLFCEKLQKESLGQMRYRVVETLIPIEMGIS